MAKLSDRGVKSKSEKLIGRRIGIGVCGGIGAVEVIKIIRELRRHGAEVTPFFTPGVTDFITELSVEWAAERKVVSRIGAGVDHLQTFHLVIVAPATLNTLSKCALGITDNPVTILVASQFGRNAPLLFVPTMNLDLKRHPLYEEYRNRLRSWGAEFFESEEDEDRLKMPAPETLAVRAIEMLG